MINVFRDSEHLEIRRVRVSGVTTKGLLKVIGEAFIEAEKEGATHWSLTTEREWYGRDIVFYREATNRELALRNAQKLEAEAKRIRTNYRLPDHD